MVMCMQINFEPDYIGLSTTGIPTADAIWFYNVASNSGFAHSLQLIS